MKSSDSPNHFRMSLKLMPSRSATTWNVAVTTSPVLTDVFLSFSISLVVSPRLLTIASVSTPADTDRLNNANQPTAAAPTAMTGANATSIATSSTAKHFTQPSAICANRSEEQKCELQS